MDFQDDYSVKHTEIDESNTKTANISLILSLKSMSHQMVHTHLNNRIWYIREDSTVWRTKFEVLGTLTSSVLIVKILKRINNMTEDPVDTQVLLNL